MTWFSDLVDIYDQNKDLVGIPKSKEEDRMVTLLPISHRMVNVPIQIEIDETGNFISADAVYKSDQKTVIPTTEDSASRSSGIFPMPVDDKLKYVSRDYYKWSKNKKDKKYYEAYIKQLQQYADYLDTNGSDISRRTIAAIFKYVSNHDVLSDLTNIQHLFGEKQTGYDIQKTWKGKDEKPLVYQVATGSPLDSYVRFKVILKATTTNNRWENPVLFNDWIKYYNHVLSKKNLGLDYITASEKEILTKKHLNGILPVANNAKLISANDTSNYTFRGRFLDSSEVVGLNYEKSQKAQLALKWLIEKQGFSISDREYLAWGVKEDFSVANDYQNSVVMMALINSEKNKKPTTNEALANEIKGLLIKGINEHNVRLSDKTYIMELEAPVPGRIDILYYQTLNVEKYIDKLSSWYGKTAISTNDKKLPSLGTIAKLAYGTVGDDKKVRINNKLYKNVVSELVRIILTYQVVPDELLLAIFRKAVHPLSFGKSSDYGSYITWNNTINTAARLYRTKYSDEKFKLYLDTQNISSAYLFGRLLALAYILEYATYDDNERNNRRTIAERYMAQFVNRPLDTWKNIYLRLQPYFGKKSSTINPDFIKYEIDLILDKIKVLSNTNDELNRSLMGSGEFLIGFVQQRNIGYQKKNNPEIDAKDEKTYQLNSEIDNRSYLFGRLLGIADSIERQTLNEQDDARLTNAQRYMRTFVLRPLETWKTIYSNIQPYINQSAYAVKNDQVITEITNKLSTMDDLNQPLNGIFLIGFAQQKIYLLKKDKKIIESLSNLDTKNLDRSYLFGRLLAISDILEKNVLISNAINRPTNVKIYLSSFLIRPVSTWKTIYNRLKPYINRSKYKSTAENMIQEISSKLDMNITNEQPLSGLSLVGYAQQKVAWNKFEYKKEK
ncbi:CRISPR-associated protein Csd1 [Lactobacillus colini]|uniref:CRISPR-associated protein Csd1 n=1 Tax=Lactobacillus colini TaxID=1819254 RepID=A0ABS4MH17_9LACO|nr:type I-C CRISPR-associated protein Cas8c/Csd1 [Lactobacillus colini]MBP2058983.1 CRISPR-associated protein Csd1 [Lactobacillus colini]